MRQSTRLGGAVPAVGLAAGPGLAGPGTASATAGCPAWDGTQPPVPGGQGMQQGLRSVAAGGPCDVWMVGSNFGSGDALIEHWAGGPSWTAMSIPRPPEGAGLSSVSAISPAGIWAARTSREDTAATAVRDVAPAGMVTCVQGRAVPVAAPGRDRRHRKFWTATAGKGGPGAFVAHYDGTG